MSSIPPSGPVSGPEFGSTPPSNTDWIAEAIYLKLADYVSTGSPAQQQMAEQLMLEFNNKYNNGNPPPGSHVWLESQITALMTGMPPSPPGSPVLDVYISLCSQNGLHLTEADLNAFCSSLTQAAQSAGDTWSIAGFPPTPVDTVFLNASSFYFSYTGPITNLKGLVSNLGIYITTTVGSNGDPALVKSWIDSQFTDPTFSTDYDCGDFVHCMPDFESFASAVGYTMPSFTTAFFSFAMFMTQFAPGTDEYKLASQLFAQYQNGWATNNPSLAVNYMNNEIANFYPDCPNISMDALETYESTVGVPVPPLQSLYFQLNGDIQHAPPPGDLTIYNAMMTQLKSIWPAGSQDAMNTWFTGLVNGANDVYMQYPLASVGAVSNVGVMCGVSSVPGPTTLDGQYQQVEQYLAGLTNPSDDYTFITAFAQQIYDLKSSGQMTSLNNWATTEVNSEFGGLKVTSATVNKFLSYFSFELTATYLNRALIQDEAGYTQPYDKQFVTMMRALLSGYSMSTPPLSIAGFQTYLNQAYYQKIDFCIQFPGLSPDTIYGVFNSIGIQSPHTYSTLDVAYSMMYQYTQSNQMPPADKAAFIELFKLMSDTEANDYPQTHLFSTYIVPAIATALNSGTLSSAAEAFLTTIKNLPPYTPPSNK